MLLKTFYSSSNDNYIIWEGFTAFNPKSHIPMVNLTYGNRFVFESTINYYEASKKKAIFSHLNYDSISIWII